MSTAIKLQHGTRVVVADGRKALFLLNEGDKIDANLKVTQVVEAPANPRTSGQGSDRPGSTVSAGRHGGFAQTDWHQAAEDQFADSVVAVLAAGDRPPALILIAPPKFLARLRERLPPWAKAVLKSEIPKDLTHLTVGEIEKSLTG